MSKRIVYIGQEKCDFAYYLAAVLSTTGTVLVADNSFRGDLFSSVNKNPQESVYEWRNITFTRDLNLAEGTDEFEYVLVYAGLDVDDEHLYDAKDTFYVVMPDYTGQCIEALKKLPIDLSANNVLMITRDKCSKKTSAKGLAVILGISPKKIEGYIELSVKDTAAYNALTINGRQNIKGTSDVMQQALMFTASKILLLNEKQTKKVMAKARRVK